jgi:hypothetical protein
VLSLLLLLLAVAATAGACRRHHERIVFTDLPAAPGVREGGAVLFRGIDIGTIQRVTLMHSGARGGGAGDRRRDGRASLPAGQHDYETVTVDPGEPCMKKLDIAGLRLAQSGRA